MPLTLEEKQIIIDSLDRLDKNELDIVLMSVDSFLNWLEITLNYIYVRINANSNSNLLTTIRAWFNAKPTL